MMLAMGEIFGVEPLWLWLSLAFVLIGAELLTGTLFLGGAATAALIIAGILWLAPGILPHGRAQLAAFAVLMLALGLMSRRLAAPWRNEQAAAGLNDRMSRVMGSIGTAEVDFNGGAGSIQTDGVVWRARLKGGGDAAAGDSLRVTGEENGVLIVEKV